MQFLLLLLAWFDLYQHEPRLPTIDGIIYQPDLPRSIPMPQLGVARTMMPLAVHDRLLFAYLPDPAADYINRRFALFLNCNLLDKIPKCDGFFPLDPATHTVLFGHDPHDPLLDFLGVSEVATMPTNTLFWIWRPAFMPFLTGGQRPRFTDRETTLQWLAGTNFNPREEVFLPLEARTLIAATNPVAVRILSAKFSSQRIEAGVEANAPALLVAAQTYFHPWQAYVDGKPTRLWRANYAFQAFEVPGGSHRVELVYEDRQFQLGAIISLTTLAGGCIAFYLRRPARKQAG